MNLVKFFLLLFHFIFLNLSGYCKSLILLGGFKKSSSLDLGVNCTIQKKTTLGSPLRKPPPNSIEDLDTPRNADPYADL